MLAAENQDVCSPFNLLSGGLLVLMAISSPRGFPGSSVVKNPHANAGDMCSIPGLGRSPGEGIATHSSILAWKIPWMEEPGKLQSMGSQSRHD